MGIIRNKKKAQIDFSIYSNNETGEAMLEELKDRDVIREKEIKSFLKCDFIILTEENILWKHIHNSYLKKL